MCHLDSSGDAEDGSGVWWRSGREIWGPDGGTPGTAHPGKILVSVLAGWLLAAVCPDLEIKIELDAGVEQGGSRG
jgi:hypothetical protein